MLLYFLCGYAQSCAFISVIELPRIPAYYPKYKKHGESLGKETKNHKNVVYPSMYMFRIFLRIILSLWLSAPFVTPRISATSFCFKSRGGSARNLLMHLLMPDSLPNHAVIDRPVALAGNH